MTNSGEKSTADTRNEFGQPVGEPLVWKPAQWPPNAPFPGQHGRVVEFDPDRHTTSLFALLAGTDQAPLWTYLPYGPFSEFTAFRSWQTQLASAEANHLLVIENGSGEACGQFSLSYADPAMGTVELAHVLFSPRLSRSTLASEAVYLVLQEVFRLGFRRCAWKCNALNAASKRAAERFGFQYEGTFRQMLVVKGRNRDTTWFGMTDSDWPQVKQAFARWLAEDNFTDDGRQRTALRSFMPGNKT